MLCALLTYLCETYSVVIISHKIISLLILKLTVILFQASVSGGWGLERKYLPAE